MFAVGSWMLLAAPAMAQGDMAGSDMAGSDMAGSDMAMEQLEGALGVAMHQVLGAYLVDGAGRTLYVVVDENGAPVACDGACAEAWPPFLAPVMSEDAMGDEGMSDDGMGDGSMGEEAMGDEGMSDDGMGDGSKGEEAMGEDPMGDEEMAEESMQDDAMTTAMVDASLIGTVDRADGKAQVTFAGFPLYYFVNDVLPGEVNCQAVAQFGGTWFVLAPDGEVVRTTLTAGP